MCSALRNFLILSRANIQISSLPTAVLGIVLSAGGWSAMLTLTNIIFVLLYFVLLTYACNLNCLCDLQVDSKFKTYMSDAVRSLGLAKIRIILRVEVVLAALLIALLCVLENEILFSLALVGLLCAFAYSSPPMRIKNRGYGSMFPVIFGLYFLPIVAGEFVANRSVSLPIIVFASGYAFLMQGITFINTCEDYMEDKEEGIQTLAHKVGIRNTLYLGALLVSGGGVVGLTTLTQIMRRRLAIPRLILFFLLIGFFIAVVVHVSHTLILISRSQNPMALSKRMAPRMRIMFMTTRYPLLAMALLLL